MERIKRELMQIGCEEPEAEALYLRYEQAGRVKELEEYVKAKIKVLGYFGDDCDD